MTRFLSIFFSLLAFTAIAQNSQRDLSVSLEQLRQTALFVECAEFKTNIEEQTRSVATNPTLTANQLNQLRIAYTGIFNKYDTFLKAVKQDLVNPQRIQYITQNPNGEAVQYASHYAAVRAEYDSQYMPLMQSISGGGKSILDDLKAMGQSAFTQLASQVLATVTNKIQQKLTINAMLNKTFGSYISSKGLILRPI